MLLYDFVKQNKTELKAGSKGSLEDMALMLVSMLAQLELMDKNPEMVNGVILKYLHLYALSESCGGYDGFDYMLDMIESQAVLDVKNDSTVLMLEMIVSLTNFVTCKRNNKYTRIDIVPVYGLFHQYNN